MPHGLVDKNFKSIQPHIDMNKQLEVKNFYSKLKFPGLYTIDDLSYYDHEIVNPFIRSYTQVVRPGMQILDVGCGSGFITNLIARKFSSCSIDAVDFSDAIDYAATFSRQHGIKNVNYFKKDIFEFNGRNYDLIISNGVIHHIPEYACAVEHIKSMLSPQGQLVMGVYIKSGKFLKKLINIKYRNDILYVDQEQAPFEVAFTNKEFLRLFPEYTVNHCYPSIQNKLVDWVNMLNYKNGGLTVFHLCPNCTIK